MTVDQEAITTTASYSASEAATKWTWIRVLPVGWLITWRASVAFILVIVAILGPLSLVDGTTIDVSFLSGETATLVVMGAMLFILGIFPLAISVQMATKKAYQDFQIRILGDQGVVLPKLHFGQAARVGWLILWRSIALALVITLVLALPLIMLGFYELNDSGDKMTVTTPWFIFLPIYIFTLRTALRKRYRGFHLMPVSPTEDKTEN